MKGTQIHVGEVYAVQRYGSVPPSPGVALTKVLVRRRWKEGSKTLLAVDLLANVRQDNYNLEAFLPGSRMTLSARQFYGKWDTDVEPWRLSQQAAVLAKARQEQEAREQADAALVSYREALLTIERLVPGADADSRAAGVVKLVPFQWYIKSDSLRLIAAKLAEMEAREQAYAGYGSILDALDI